MLKQHAMFPVPGALPADVVGPRQFPKVFAWIERFRGAVEKTTRKSEGEAVGSSSGGGGSSGEPKSLSGEEAARVILGAPFAELAGEEDPVDEKDPVAVAQGLKQGAKVRLWPTDSGSFHKDSGVLVSFKKGEVVIETRGANGDGEALVKLHAPRHGFRVRRIVEDGESKL